MTPVDAGHAPDTDADGVPNKGPIAWMARNTVAANLAMLVLLIGGVVAALNIKQEVFPEFELDIITVAVPYPGASPAEVEQGITLAIEEAIRGVDGVKEITSSSAEGGAGVTIELLLGADKAKVLNDIKSAIDRITSFPKEAERPTVSLLSNRREVINLVIYGDLNEHTRHRLADKIRNDLLADPRITQADLSGVRPLEIAIEIPLATLRTYNLTLPAVADIIRRHAVELPAGAVKTSGGEILLRTAERRDAGKEFHNIPIISLPDGTEITLGSIAKITDGFIDDDQSASFNGKPAVMVQVFRVGDETPIEVAAAAREYVDSVKDDLPGGAKIAVYRDYSEIYRDRMDLLMRNAMFGLLLVLLVLGAFLEVRLAFWVTMGIPISFLGSLLFVPSIAGVSLNMISLFAFIVALGMVVDDAIVVGENIHELRKQGVPPLKAAIVGAQGVGMPVVFAVLTTITAFSPLFFVPGFTGKLFMQIPAVVVSVFVISLFESLFVLPAHLAHLATDNLFFVWRWIGYVQEPISDLMDTYIERVHKPVLAGLLRWRYLTVAVGIALLLGTLGYVKGGRVEFSFMPRVEGDIITARAELVYGSPITDTEKVRDRLVRAAQRVLAKSGGDAVLRGLYTEVGSTIRRGGAHGGNTSAGNLTGVQVYLVQSNLREVSASRFAKLWRDEVGEIAGLESMTYKFSMGPSAGDPIDVQLSHADMETLERASVELAGRLATFKGVKDIADGFSSGKPQFDFTIRPEATSLGITAADLAAQVRSSFYGSEALRQQRGRDELRVMVRLPESERTSAHDIENLMLRTRAGDDIPLSVAANVHRGRAYTTINRVDGRRTSNVTADIDKSQGSAGKVLASLTQKHLPELQSRYPGLGFEFGGERKHRNEALGALGSGFSMAMMVMFALLAIPFRSYVQPAVVMSAIPFGIVGAVWGHVAMGFELSIISMMGIVALSGVVVNDSLVLVDAANNKRAEGVSHFEAIHFAGARRFRPILLTSLTTFLGLAPMIVEPSVQARFLVPMAISLGFGILFSTVIVLGLVPSFYMIVEDIRAVFVDDPFAK